MIAQFRRFHVKTQIVFGRDAIHSLGELASELGAKACLLLADKALEETGVLDKARGILRDSGVRITEFLGTEPEPYLDNADAAAQLGRDGQVELVIGMGGGSVMDTAKAAAALIRNGGHAADYVGLNLVPGPGLPTIMVPTTAGTGSEVTFTAVFTNRQTKAKGGINSPRLFPDRALVDPELTLSLPPAITAATGMDALTHAIESYTSRSSAVFTEALSLAAIRLISRHLRRAVFHGNDGEAREGMLMGSLLGGMGLADAGVGAAHALAYPLGGHYRIPHGLANAVLIPHVMKFNLPAAEEKFAMIARSMGEAVEGLPPGLAGSLAVEAVARLSRDIGIPHSLNELDIPRSDIPILVEGALKVTRPVENNPRFMGAKEAEAIFERAFG
ncbi:MAG: iron-containing alcohol dehydrogenase [Deltaproteobacteria bacterium]|nr:iron-containing alcohol dehydrogenase [Deltaproteobacteria bacterium]